MFSCNSVKMYVKNLEKNFFDYFCDKFNDIDFFFYFLVIELS